MNITRCYCFLLLQAIFGFIFNRKYFIIFAVENLNSVSAVYTNLLVTPNLGAGMVCNFEGQPLLNSDSSLQKNSVLIPSHFPYPHPPDRNNYVYVTFTHQNLKPKFLRLHSV